MTNAPKTIRYHPNALKSFFRIYERKNLIATTETTKDTIIPVSRIDNSKGVKRKPNFNNFKALAPTITGIERKNENSAATALEVPIKIAPTMVAPDRDVPGINAKT